MHDSHFDSFTRSLSAKSTRRNLLVSVIGAAGIFGIASTKAKKKGGKGKKKKPHRPSVSPPAPPPATPPNACDAFPADNTYRISCKELAQRAASGSIGVRYSGYDGSPTCRPNAGGVTVSPFTFTKTYTPATVKLGTGYLSTTRNLKATVAVDSRVTTIDWQRIGSDASPKNTGCAALEHDIEEHVRLHEAHHVADAQAIADDWNRTWIPVTTGIAGRGPTPQSAEAELEVKITQLLEGRGGVGGQRQLLEEDRERRADEYHRSTDRYARFPVVDCKRCDMCGDGTSGQARDGTLRSAASAACGDVCCGPCEECRDPAASTCAPKTCPSGGTCRPDTGQCTANCAAGPTCPKPVACPVACYHVTMEPCLRAVMDREHTALAVCEQRANTCELPCDGDSACLADCKRKQDLCEAAAEEAFYREACGCDKQFPCCSEGFCSSSPGARALSRATIGNGSGREQPAGRASGGEQTAYGGKDEPVSRQQAGGATTSRHRAKNPTKNGANNSENGRAKRRQRRHQGHHK